MTGRGDDFRRKPQAGELLGHPLGRKLHVAAMGRFGTDARDAEELAEFLLESRGLGHEVSVDRGVDSGHGNVFRETAVFSRKWTPLGHETPILAGVSRSEAIHDGL
jgi:hypothetical protein